MIVNSSVTQGKKFNNLSMITIKTSHAVPRARGKADFMCPLPSSSSKMRVSASKNQVWDEAKDRADKIIRLIDTQARPVGEEIIGFAKSDFDKLKQWCDEYKSNVGDGKCDTASNQKGSGDSGRRKWKASSMAHDLESESESPTESPSTIDVEAA